MPADTSNPRVPNANDVQVTTERGPQLVSISIADNPESWTAAGFAVDPSGGLMIGNTLIQLVGGEGGVTGWSFDRTAGIRNLDDDHIDGIVLAGVTSRRVLNTRPNPNGIVSIDHVVIRSDDCDASRAAFEAAGFPVRRERVTKSFGATMRQIFFWAGDVILELIGPADSGTTDSCRNTGANARPGAQEHRASEVFGITFVASDLDRTCQHLGELVGPPRRAVQVGRSIASLRSGDIGISIPIAIMSPHPRSK